MILQKNHQLFQKEEGNQVDTPDWLCYNKKANREKERPEKSFSCSLVQPDKAIQKSTVDAVETPIGYEPKPEDINVDGLVYESKQFTSEDVASLLELDIDLWKDEVKELREFYKQFGDKLPVKIKEELDALEARLSK